MEKLCDLGRGVLGCTPGSVTGGDVTEWVTLQHYPGNLRPDRATRTRRTDPRWDSGGTRRWGSTQGIRDVGLSGPASLGVKEEPLERPGQVLPAVVVTDLVDREQVSTRREPVGVPDGGKGSTEGELFRKGQDSWSGPRCTTVGSELPPRTSSTSPACHLNPFVPDLPRIRRGVPFLSGPYRPDPYPGRVV